MAKTFQNLITILWHLIAYDMHDQLSLLGSNFLQVTNLQ